MPAKKTERRANGKPKAYKAPSVPHMIQSAGGPTVWGRICGFKKNPGPRGSDMLRRNFVPVEYWPGIVAFGKSSEAPSGFLYVTYKAIVEAHVGKELSN